MLCVDKLTNVLLIVYDNTSVSHRSALPSAGHKDEMIFYTNLHVLKNKVMTFKKNV